MHRKLTPTVGERLGHAGGGGEGLEIPRASFGPISSLICAENSNPLLTHLAADPSMKKKFSFEIMLNTVGVDDHGTYNCFKCLEVCPLNQ